MIVVALVGALVTTVVRGCGGPVELGAELSDVAVDQNVTLDEYAIRHQSASTAAPARVLHVTVQFAQATADELQQEELPQEEPQPDEPQPDEPQPDEPQPDEPQPEEPQPEEPQPGDETTPDDVGVLLARPLSQRESGEFNAGVQEAIDHSQMDVGAVCEADASDPACPFRELVFLPSEVGTQALVVENEGPLSADAVARRLEKVFTGTRTLSVAGARQQMVGVTVNFNVTMTGFDDGNADIRWSLYSAGRNAPVPRDWLRTQRALSLRGEADKDSASGEFWVPLPKAKGPFFIRLSVHDDNDTRLDYADTPRFR